MNRIILATPSESDAEAIAKAVDCEVWEICDFEDFIGMYWYAHTCVVINVPAIVKSAGEVAEELGLDRQGNLEEIIIGFYSTLIHELRHLGLDCPYLPEELYPSELEAEDAVEDWCRSQTDVLLPELRDMAEKYHEKEAKANVQTEQI